MPSTYTDNGIEKPGNGEQSGAWGTTANTNYDIIDVMSHGVASITLSGTTHTLTTSDGTLSDGAHKVLVFGGAPSGTNTVTVSPNDATHVYYAINSTSEDIVLTQGSGGNVTVPAGNAAIVYCDGAGTGAEVVDITAEFGFIPATDIGTTVQAYDAELAAIAALATTDGNFIVGNGSTWVAESGNTAIASLGITASSTELNVLDGITASTAELNILDGVTASTAEINILDGVTATTSEINILDGVTATTAEINVLDGLTATTTELNYVDGVTSAIQTQIDAKAPLASPTFTGQVDAGDSIKLGLWEIYDTGTTLFFRYNGTDVFKVDSSGNATATGDVTAYGSI